MTSTAAPGTNSPGRMSLTLWPSPPQSHAWWISQLLVTTREGTDLHSQCVSPYQEVQMEGRVRFNFRNSVVSSRAQGPIFCMFRMSALCSSFFPTSYEMAATVPAITSRHGYVLNSLEWEKPCPQAAHSSAPSSDDWNCQHSE